MSVRWFRTFCLIMVLGSSVAHAASHAPARHKPGPVSIRGVVDRVGPVGFTLSTAHHGTYSVITQHATQVSEKGTSEALHVRNGDHVSVRGFLSGRTLRAIRIRIFPTKPKSYTLRGTVTAIHGSVVIVVVAAGSVNVHVTGSTSITVGVVPASLVQVRPGGSVRMRVENVQGTVSAISIHVNAVRTAARHVQVRGTITALARRSIIVASGSKRYTVGLSNGTIIRMGSAVVSTAVLRSGQSVTVYACCQGMPLVATSIHVRKTAVSHRVVDIRGRVLSLGHGTIRLSTANGDQAIRVTSATRFELGSAPVSSTSIRTGDDVSVHAYRSGPGVIAQRVHIYASSRQVKRVLGTLVAVASPGLTMTTGTGKRYIVRVGPTAPITLGGKTTRVAGLHPGDHLRVKGHIIAVGVLVVIRVDATRPRLKSITIHGTITSIKASSLLVVDATGSHYRVRLAPGVNARLHGKTAPSVAVFSGVRATVRGRISGGTLIASSLTVSVTSRTIHGRIDRTSSAALVVRVTLTHSVRVDLPASVMATDGSRHVAARGIRAGAYIRAEGYEESAGSIRALSISVEHPAIDVTATVVSAGQTIIVRTSPGERYQLRFSPSTSVMSSQAHVTLQPTDIVTGDHVRVQGRVDSDGILAAAAVTVRLGAATIRGQVAALAAAQWIVQATPARITVRLPANTPITQGAHVLLSADVVIGDDVTIHGYVLATSKILARRITVHRKITALDGDVASLTTDGFILHAASGDHRVILSASTVLSGTAQSPSVGSIVHVTGYLRGDGVILATRLRAGKQAGRRAPTPTVPPTPAHRSVPDADTPISSVHESIWAAPGFG